jgi:hypothetical protein
MNVKLEKALNDWSSPGFSETMKTEIRRLDRTLLPLQQGLSHSSYVSDSEISVVILNSAEREGSIIVRTGIFYGGIIAGSCCADDPTTVCEENEYCEVQFTIDRDTAETEILLV